MKQQTTTNYIELNPGILELLYIKGYHYFVRHDLTLEDYQVDATFDFEVTFFRTKPAALAYFQTIQCNDKFIGHVIQDDAVEMASRVFLCRFYIKNRTY